MTFGCGGEVDGNGTLLQSDAISNKGAWVST